MTTIRFTFCLQWPYPNDLRVPGREMSRRAYDWLIEAGFLSAEPFWKNEKDIRDGTKSAEYVRYRMNEAGPKALGRLNGAGNADPCFASRKVTGVKSFTPCAETLGVRSSRVSYGWTREHRALDEQCVRAPISRARLHAASTRSRPKPFTRRTIPSPS
jgi:hypothetical protein